MTLQFDVATLRFSRATHAVADHFESDAAYFSRRASEELAAAARSADAPLQALHRELADRYAGLAATLREAEEQLG